MKSILRFPIFIVGLIFLSLSITEAEGSSSSKIQFLKKLSHFPKHLTPYSRVKPVFSTLVKLDPLRAPRYFRLAIRSLKTENAENTVSRLYQKALTDVDNSSLTADEKNWVIDKLTSILTGGNSGYFDSALRQ